MSLITFPGAVSLTLEAVAPLPSKETLMELC